MTLADHLAALDDLADGVAETERSCPACGGDIVGIVSPCLPCRFAGNVALTLFD